MSGSGRGRSGGSHAGLGPGPRMLQGVHPPKDARAAAATVEPGLLLHLSAIMAAHSHAAQELPATVLISPFFNLPPK